MERDNGRAESHIHARIGRKIVIVENVPARVCLETGERIFSPQTVAHLQRVVWEEQEPSRMIEVPVFEFAQWPITKLRSGGGRPPNSSGLAVRLAMPPAG